MLAHDDLSAEHGGRWTRSVFPLRLNLGDLLYDPHLEHWLPVVALRLTESAVLVSLGDDPDPVALPQGRLVKVRRAAEDTEEIHDEIYQTWYAGDLAAVSAAHAAHSRIVEPTVERPAAAPYAASELNTETPEVAAGALLDKGPHPVPPMTDFPDQLTGWYAGDLDAVLIEHAATRAEVEARRQAHMSAKSTSTPRPKGSNQDEVFEASDEVEERMGGWYGGDLDFIIRHHK
ncbi:MAG: hypothetical protein ACOYEV_09765 [Candidatus Nanopelagicales bacterium]